MEARLREAEGELGDKKGRNEGEEPSKVSRGDAGLQTYTRTGDDLERDARGAGWEGEPPPAPLPFTDTPPRQTMGEEKGGT